MSYESKIKFTKSLRFRLTLLYSAILFIFTATFVLAVNLYLNDYFNREPPEMPEQNTFHPPIPFREMDEDQLFQIMEIRQNDLKRIQQISIISLAPISLASFGLGYLISGYFLSPLKELRKKLSELENNTLGKTIKVEEDDEIGELTKNFNEMSIRLKRSFDSQTQFVEDASHEIRTPLTIIQTNLDTIKKPNEQIKTALLGIKRLAHLTESLLTLTNTTNLPKAEKDIRTVIREQCDLLGAYAKKQYVKLEVVLPTKPVIRKINRDQLGRAIFNLIDNGIKYSSGVKLPRVVVTLSEKGDKAIISIKDNGLGIPKDKKVLVFNRFYRVDKSRSRRTGGFGLGLAITKKIIEEHSGKISFSSKKGRTEFIAEL